MKTEPQINNFEKDLNNKNNEGLYAFRRVQAYNEIAEANGQPKIELKGDDYVNSEKNIQPANYPEFINKSELPDNGAFNIFSCIEDGFRKVMRSKGIRIGKNLF